MLMAVYAFDLRGYHRLYSFSYWGFFVILVVVAGLRYRLGTDSIVYEGDYETVPKLWQLTKYKFDSTRFEPGFMVFQSIPRSISSDFTLLQFFHAIVVNLVLFWFILKNTTHRFLCLSFYFIVMYLNLNMQVLRETLAVCCFLLAWPSFRDGKWLWYYLFVLLACTFHTSALLLLILPLVSLPGIREGFIFGKRTFIICALLLVLGMILQANFKSFFTAIALTDRMADRAQEYSQNEYGGARLNIVGIIYTLLHYALYPLVALYFLHQKYSWKYTKNKKWKRLQKIQNRDYSRWEMMTLLGIYFTILSIPIFIFNRYYNYFGIFCLATVANWAFTKLRVNRKSYKLKFAYWIVILIPFYFLNVWDYGSGLNRSGRLKTYMIYYPYNTRLDPEMDTNREAIYRYFNAR